MDNSEDIISDPEDENRDLFYFEVPWSCEFHQLIDLLQAVVKEGNFLITNDGLEFNKDDFDGIMIIEFFISKSDLGKFFHNTFDKKGNPSVVKIGLMFTYFKSIIKNVSKNDRLVMSMSESDITRINIATIYNTDEMRRSMKSIIFKEIELQDPHKFNLENETPISIKVKNFSNILKAFVQSKIVEIYIEKTNVGIRIGGSLPDSYIESIEDIVESEFKDFDVRKIKVIEPEKRVYCKVNKIKPLQKISTIIGVKSEILIYFSLESQGPVIHIFGTIQKLSYLGIRINSIRNTGENINENINEDVEEIKSEKKKRGRPRKNTKTYINTDDE